MKWYSLVKLLAIFVLIFSTETRAYQIQLDTSIWEGTQASVAYDLIDGSPGTSEIRFEPLLIDGELFGSGGFLRDTSFYNTVSQQIILGTTLIVPFSLGSGGIPSSGYLPDSLAIFLLDIEGFPLFPTDDPTGADSLIQWDIGVNQPTAFAGMLSNPNEPPHSLPEPTTLFLILAVLAGLGLQRGRRLFSLILGSVILVNASTAISGPNLSTSTELGTQVQLTASGLRLNRQTNTFDSVLTIRNISQTNLTKPFTVAVLSLPNDVILTNATGVLDEGFPFITLEGGDSLVPGASLSLTLKFVNRSNSAFPLSFRLIRLEQPIPILAQLQGPDRNGNGVRDDLEALLDSRYSNTAERNSAIQVLKRMRNGLAATGSVESAFNAAVSLNKAFDCLYSVVGLDRGIKESEFLRDQMMNTPERIRAWLTFNDNLAGQSIAIGSTNSCEAP